MGVLPHPPSPALSPYPDGVQSYMLVSAHVGDALGEGGFAVIGMKELFKIVDELPHDQKRQLLQRLEWSLREQNPVRVPARSWHDSLRATYGILSDDPIERPPQPPLEEREPVE